MPRAPKEKSAKVSKPAGLTRPLAEAQSSKAALSIDDIFASKPKPPPPTPASSSTSKAHTNAANGPSTSFDTDKKKKKKKTKLIASFDPADSSPAKTLRAPVEVVEVVDPSLPVPRAKKEAAAVETAKKGKKRDKKETEEDAHFRDSRGDGPRRKTEEGFLIYKEAELQIDPEAGGTPLCPFDCDCCF